MKTKLLSISIGILALATLSTNADPIVNDPAATSLGVVAGGDAGEGLDLDGNFLYALSFGADPTQSWKVRDAVFKGLRGSEVPGATIAANQTIPNWYVVDYGDSANDDNLEKATSSIRYSDGGNSEPQVVTVTLGNVQVGAQYKLQLMFGEQCCNRSFDVVVDGVVIVKDFNPGLQQGGVAVGNQEALITHTLSATKPSIVVALNGPTASDESGTDNNAIFNALTLEQLGGAADSDGDGLPDAWENLYFKNLAQTASGDPDNDGLTNAQELAAGTDPTIADTDGDGLSDKDEVLTYKSDPTKTDTDGDGLSDKDEALTYKSDPTKADGDGDYLPDSLEVKTYHTDPAKADSDGDGANDYAEVILLTDPLNPNSKPTKATANLFFGPAAGQGLDLTGNFTYAIAFGNERPGGQVGSALFTADSAPGVTVDASQVANDWNQAGSDPDTGAPINGVDFGSSPEQLVLSDVLRSIRWSDSGNAVKPFVTVTLGNLKVGAQYKLQLLFGERLWARAFDVAVNGKPIAKAFAPFQWQGGFTGPGGATPRTNGVVLNYTFVANKTDAVIDLDGRPVTFPGISDRNAIINGLTLEEVQGAVDSDGDGLPDAWETENFGNLSQTANGDPDNDGLTNAQEFANGTDPNNADSDGDGLKDGEEINTTKTDPSNADTDGDGLKDGDEVNVYKTDPNKADSDGDGLPDGDEVLTTGAKTKISNVVVQAVTGGDPGEGLDLQGTFKYAVNVSSAGAAGKAGDADFTADNVPGVTVIAPNNIANWDTPAYGDTAADDVIEKVMQSIRYGGTIKILLDNLTPGSTYRLQMLFFEQCCGNRGFNIYVDGELLTADFSPPNIQGSPNQADSGAVVVADIETQRTQMGIVLTVNGRTDPNLTDPNAIIDGFTLETIKEGPVQTKPTLTLTTAAGGKITVTTDSTLQSADVVTGPYTNLPDKTLTVDPKTGGKAKFYRATRP
jgi:hypothetical protein